MKSAANQTTVILESEGGQFAALTLTTFAGTKANHMVGTYNPSVAVGTIFVRSFDTPREAIDSFGVAVSQAIKGGWRVIYHGEPMKG